VAEGSAIPLAPSDSLVMQGDSWTITGERLEGNKTGVTRLVTPRAVQEGTTVTAREGIWYRADDLLQLTGDVVLRDSVRTLTGDRATYDRRRGLAIFTGRVKGMGPEGRIAAHELWYWRSEGRIELTDSVHVEEGTRSVEARKIVYDTRSHTGVATGDVVLSDSRDSTRVTGARCDLDRGQDLAIVTGSPMLHRPGAPGERDLNIVADTLTMASGRSIGAARGNVKILRGSVEAHAGNAVFDFGNDLLRLRDEPVVIDPEGEVTGDSMAIVLRSGRAERLEVLGRARVLYHPGDKPGEKNFVWGDTLVAHFDTLGIREIQVRGSALSYYFPSPGDREDGVGSNLSRGRRIRVSLDAGQAQLLELDESASGEYLLPREKPDTTFARLSDSLFVARAVAAILAAPDRPLTDSLEHAGPFDAAQRVAYQGDQVVFHVPERKIEIRGSGRVRYQNLELDSQEIDYDARNDRVTALGEPTLKDPSSELLGTRMTYRMDRRQGFVYQGRTEFDGGFYRGEEIKRVDNKILLVDSGDYTTCDADTSHFHFHSHRMKIRLGDKVVARPIVMYLKNIPLMALPYWVFPIRKGRHSGILMPNVEFGFDVNKGRFIRNLGYYYAPNDYADAMVWADYYESNPRYYLNGQLRYKLRYVLSGRLFSSFSRETYSGGRTRYDIQGDHSQELGERAALTFRANFVSDKTYRDNRDFGGTVDERLNRILKSSLDVRKSWSAVSLSSTIDRIENLDRETSTYQIQQNIPSLDLAVNQFPIGVKPDDRGRAGRLPALSTVYTRLNASVRSAFLKPWGKPMADNQAARISSGLSDNRSLGPYLKITPSVSATGAYFRRDNLGHGHEVGWVWDAGASARSGVFGTFPIGIGPLIAMRHVVEPSVSYRYSPENDALKVHDAEGHEISRFPSVGGISLSSSKASSMSLNLSQRFHLKLRGRDPKKPIKIDNLILWSTSSGYNFLAKKENQKWSTITNTIRVQPASFLDNSWTFSHDPYRKIMRSLSVQTSLRLAGTGGGGADTSSAGSLDDYGSFGQAGSGYGRPGEKARSHAGPWSLNLSHSYSRGESRSSESSTINVSSTLSPTLYWKVTYSLYVDTRLREVRSQAFSIYRDLHCWEIRFDRRVTGGQGEYYFRINVKDLPDVKYERQQ
jgi:lipopolysaccharide export system protein LptA